MERNTNVNPPLISLANHQPFNPLALESADRQIRVKAIPQGGGYRQRLANQTSYHFLAVLELHIN